MIFILMQIKLIFTRKVLHSASVWSEGYWNSKMAFSTVIFCLERLVFFPLAPLLYSCVLLVLARPSCPCAPPPHPRAGPAPFLPPLNCKIKVTSTPKMVRYLMTTTQYSICCRWILVISVRKRREGFIRNPTCLRSMLFGPNAFLSLFTRAVILPALCIH